MCQYSKVLGDSHFKPSTPCSTNQLSQQLPYGRQQVSCPCPPPPRGGSLANWHTCSNRCPPPACSMLMAVVVFALFAVMRYWTFHVWQYHVLRTSAVITLMNYNRSECRRATASLCSLLSGIPMLIAGWRWLQFIGMPYIVACHT